MSEISEKFEQNINVTNSSNPLHNVLTNTPNQNDDVQLTPGRQKLRSWLGRVVRIVITDGRVLVGFLNCTDRDANIVLSMCAEYLVEGKDERLLGNVMVPGRHIVSISLDLPPGACTDLCQLPQMYANNKLEMINSSRGTKCLVVRLKRKQMKQFLEQCGVKEPNKSVFRLNEVKKQAFYRKEDVTVTQARESREKVEVGHENPSTTQTNEDEENVEVPAGDLTVNTQS